MNRVTHQVLRSPLETAQPFSFDSFEADGVVNMVHKVDRSLRVLAEGSEPSETNDGYGKLTVTYVGP